MNLRKIIREEMEDDFGWIRDIPAFLPGKNFDDNNVCFDEDDNCEVTIENDKIVFNIDLDDFISRWGGYDDEYYLKPLIQNSWAGEIYDGDGDYYEFDSDEFNYLGYQVGDQLKRRFIDFIMEVDKDLDSDDVNNFFNDHMLGIEGHLRYPKLYNDFDNLVGEVLSALGYAVQENRWLSISRTFIDRMEQVREMGVEVEFEHGRWGHENLIITVPMEVVNQIHRKKQFKDLSGLFDYVINPITDVAWSDWFYEEWDSSGASDKINESWGVFLDNAEDYLENEDYQEERKFVDYCYDVLKSKGWVLRGGGPNRFNKVDPNIRTLTHNLNIDSLKPSFIKSRGFINGKTWNSRQNSWRDYNEITTEVQDGDIYETFKKFLDEVESRAGIIKEGLEDFGWTEDSSFSEVERLNDYLKKNTDFYMVFNEDSSNWAIVDIFKKNKKFPLMPYDVARVRPLKDNIKIQNILRSLDDKAYNLEVRETRLGQNNRDEIKLIDEFMSVVNSWLKNN